MVIGKRTANAIGTSRLNRMNSGSLVNIFKPQEKPVFTGMIDPITGQRIMTYQGNYVLEGDISNGTVSMVYRKNIAELNKKNGVRSRFIPFSKGSENGFNKDVFDKKFDELNTKRLNKRIVTQDGIPYHKERERDIVRDYDKRQAEIFAKREQKRQDAQTRKAERVRQRDVEQEAKRRRRRGEDYYDPEVGLFGQANQRLARSRQKQLNDFLS